MGLKRGTRQKMDSFLAPIWRVTNLISIYWFKAFPFIHSRKKSKSRFQMVYLTGRRSSRLRFPTHYRTRVMSLRILSRFMCRPSCRFWSKEEARSGRRSHRATPIYATPEFFEMGGREVPPIEVHQGDGTPSLNDVLNIREGGWTKS